ncbi:unnamed protein product [Urochloa humidicola]
MSVPFLLIYRASLLLAPVSDPALSSSKTTPWGSNHGVGDLRSGDGRHLRLAVIGKRWGSSHGVGDLRRSGSGHELGLAVIGESFVSSLCLQVASVVGPTILR